jgi:hypothetical protein
MSVQDRITEILQADSSEYGKTYDLENYRSQLGDALTVLAAAIDESNEKFNLHHHVDRGHWNETTGPEFEGQETYEANDHDAPDLRMKEVMDVNGDPLTLEDRVAKAYREHSLKAGGL